MKIDTISTFRNLKGETINVMIGEGGKKRESLTLGAALAEIVLSPHKPKNGFRPLKGYELARLFYNNQIAEVSPADFIQIKELVEDNEIYVPLITAQIIEMLNAAKE